MKAFSGRPKKSQKLRDSARGQDCAMQVSEVCNGNQETVVLAHVNVDGGKMGGKSEDVSACFACAACHEWLDQHRGSVEDELFYTRRAMVRTWIVWIEKGILK